jgi:predicted Zn finger-like uncharacterized protein
MLVSCNSCQKKFIVPDKAITVSGRLVQCGSCGVKWTQYPVKNTEAKKSKLNKNENSIKKTRVKKNLYTPEYLQKKHGLIINKSPREPRKDKQNEKKSNNNFGFYGYLIIFFVFLTTVYGLIYLSKEMIVLKYPSAEMYINYLYEVINIIKMSINELIS